MSGIGDSHHAWIRVRWATCQTQRVQTYETRTGEPRTPTVNSHRRNGTRRPRPPHPPSAIGIGMRMDPAPRLKYSCISLSRYQHAFGTRKPGRTRPQRSTVSQLRSQRLVSRHLHAHRPRTLVSDSVVSPLSVSRGRGETGRGRDKVDPPTRDARRGRGAASRASGLPGSGRARWRISVIP